MHRVKCFSEVEHDMLLEGNAPKTAVDGDEDEDKDDDNSEIVAGSEDRLFLPSSPFSTMYVGADDEEDNDDSILDDGSHRMGSKRRAVVCVV